MGHQSLEDEPGAGRPHTAVMDENVAAVRKLITEDSHITYREIEGTRDWVNYHKYKQNKTAVDSLVLSRRRTTD